MAGNIKRGRSWARVALDAAMAALFIAAMATALVQEAPHEYLGIALILAVVAHIVLNRRWFKALFRRRYNAVRVLQLVAIVGLLACIAGQIASSLVLSKFAFGFLPALPGEGWARRIHMLCSYWGFVFAFAHAGLQFRGFARLAQSKDAGASDAAVWVARLAFAAAACFGVYSFMRLNLGAYLLGQVQFAFADYSEPIALSFTRYASVAILVGGLFAGLRRAIEKLLRGNHDNKP